MKKIFKFFLTFLGIGMLSSQTELFAQEAYQVEAPNGEIRLEDLPDNREGALAMSSVLVPLDRLRNPVLKILIPPGKITGFSTTNRDAKLVGNTIHITKKGKYNTEIRLDGQNKHNSFYVNYKAHLFYGDVSDIDSLKALAPKQIVLTDENLGKFIGIPSNHFPYSAWSLAKDSTEEGIEFAGLNFNQHVNNMKIDEILKKARELYPEHQGSVFLKLHVSDGLANYDPKTNASFDQSHCMVELVPPPAKKQYAISFSHEGEGSLIAKVDNQPINSGDLVEEGKTVVFTATPADKWRIKNWEPENGTNQEYRIVSLSQAASVKVVFEPVPTPPPPAKKQYAISFSHEGEGSLVVKVDNQPINSGDLVEEGKTVVFTATPTEKWRIKNWEPENGTNQEYRIVSLSQATSVKVVFEPVPTPPVKVDHSVTVAPLQNGTIVATPAKAKVGDQVQLKVNPAVGYRLKEGSLTVTSVGNQTISVLDNRFIMPDAEVNITAEFEPIPLDPETLLPHLTGIDTTPLKKGTGYTFLWDEMEKTATNFTLELIDTKTHKQVTNLVSSVDVNQVQLQFSQVGVFDLKIKFEVAGKAYFVSWRIIVE